VRPADDPRFFALLTGSFQRLVSRPLLPEPNSGPGWLYESAPFAVLAHDTSADPLFVYANRAAQRAFGYTWEEFVGMPSRLSAEAPERAERQRLLDAVARDGFVSGYSGIRVARDGRRFPVSEGIVWQLVDEAGTVHGQAATFPLAA
jgi:PAS domain S-box-containing protein